MPLVLRLLAPVSFAALAREMGVPIGIPLKWSCPWARPRNCNVALGRGYLFRRRVWLMGRSFDLPIVRVGTLTFISLAAWVWLIGRSFDLPIVNRLSQFVRFAIFAATVARWGLAWDPRNRRYTPGVHHCSNGFRVGGNEYVFAFCSG